MRCGDASATEAPAPSEVEALASAVVDYLATFQEVALTALAVTRVQLIACGELLPITDREIEARARALVAQQNATYVRASVDQAII